MADRTASNEDLLTEDPLHESQAGTTALPATNEKSGAAATGDGAEATEKKPKGFAAKRHAMWVHYKKYWVWYLIGTIIFLAILFPILFKVIIPAIVQLVVNNQGLPVIAGSLKALSPTEMKITLDTALNVPLPVTLDPFKLDLYNKETQPYSPFSMLEFPSEFANHYTEIKIDDMVHVTNQTELVTWFNKVYEQETVDLSVKADLAVHLGTLLNYPHLEKTIQLPGLNKLQGINIKDLQLILPAQNGINIKGTIVLPNPGVLTLDLGNLTLNLLSGDLRLGLVSVNNVVLYPGNTTKDFQGELFLSELGTNLGAVLDSQAEPLSRGVVQLNGTGNSTIVNGQHIPYLEKVLNHQKMSLEISVVTLLSKFLSGILHGGKSSIVDVLGDILGNHTFAETVMGYYNQSASGNYDTNMTTANRLMMRKATATKRSLAWQLLKAGMKMKRGLAEAS